MKKTFLLPIMIISTVLMMLCTFFSSAKTGGESLDNATIYSMDISSDIVYGDINDDGYVNVSDAITELQWIAGNTIITDEKKKISADVDVDGLISVSDIIRILQYLASPDSTVLGSTGETEQSKEDKTLIYSLLDDGTYGVTAGENASTMEIITIPESHNGIAVTQILDNGFIELSALRTINIPNSITTIGANAFRSCKSLTDVKIPKSVTFIGAYAFYKSGLVSAIFEDYTQWELEEKVKDSSLLNYTGISEWGIKNNGKRGVSSYHSTCDLNDEAIAAKALKGIITLKIYSSWAGETQYCNSISVNLYTQNWAKQ